MSDKKTQPKQYAFDMMDVLRHINFKDNAYYENMEPADSAKIPLPVVARWLSGTNRPSQLLLTNEYINRYVMSLYKHPVLIWKLMTAVAPGSAMNHGWRKKLSSQDGTSNAALAVVQRYYKCSSREAQLLLPMLTPEQLVDLAEQLGDQASDIARLNPKTTLQPAEKKSHGKTKTTTTNPKDKSKATKK